MSSYNNTLTYEPLSALISQLSLELPKFANMGLFDELVITDMVMYCIRNLGIRVYHRKDRVIHFNDGKCEIPEFLHSINFAGLCTDISICHIPPQGKFIMDVEVDSCGIPKYDISNNMLFNFVSIDKHPSTLCSRDPKCSDIVINGCNVATQEVCNDVPVKYFVECGSRFQVWQIFRSNIIRYSGIIPLKLERNHSDNIMLCESCVPYTSKINTFRKIGNAFYFNIKEGTLYINYMAYPYDENRNEILVPSDPILWNYILYYIKYRVLQNAIINGDDENIKTIYADVKQDYMRYYYEAKSLVNTPSFRQIREAWKLNRKLMTEVYYRPFLT